MSTTDKFFGQQKEKSKIKTLIVNDFFKAYFPIINYSVGQSASEIIYIDLFCGPGRFDNGEPSTPIALLDTIDSFKLGAIRQKIRIIFNDENSEYITALKKSVEEHEVVRKLCNAPEIFNKRACDVDIKKYTIKKVPIFSFIDPWGYIDISTEQIWTLVENIGSDCVLFFNSNRILMDINKEVQSEHFKQIFGDELPEAQKVAKDGRLSPWEKTQKFLELFSKNLSNRMAKSKYKEYKLFVLPFSFEADDKEKISHHIVFISKAHKAILEMKKVMVKHSNSTGEQLGYDSKDQLQISLFNRQDNIEEAVIKSIKSYFISNKTLVDQTWSIVKLLEALDNYNMSIAFQVTPYTLDDVRIAIEMLDKKNGIDINIEPGKKIKKRITIERDFKIKKEIVV
jgi:three-Cys-motif partner protein